MKRGTMKSRHRHDRWLPKIPTMITRTYYRSPYYISYKLWCKWGLNKKSPDWIINPEFADIFETSEITKNIKAKGEGPK